MKTTLSDTQPTMLQDGRSPANGVQNEAARSALVRCLDRVIVVLMVATLLTLSWPVGLVLWSSHTRSAAGYQREEGNPALPGVHRGKKGNEHNREIARFPLHAHV